MSLEEKVLSLLEATVKGLGYNICRVKYVADKNSTLQIMIEKLDGTPISVEDCATVSNTVSPILDVEDLIAAQYNLEVSSPGVDRPLVKLSDFERFKGMKVKIVLHHAQNNIRRFKGNIQDVVGSSLVFKSNDGQAITVDYTEIESANLMISEDL